MSFLRHSGRHAEPLPGDSLKVALSAPAAEAETTVLDAPAAAETVVLSEDMQAELDRIEALVAAEKAAEALARWRASRPVVPVAADMGGLPVFRGTVHSALIRTEPRHGCGQEMRGGAFAERYAAIWQHRTGAVPELDFDLGRYDGAASDVIASGLAKADAEWAAREAERAAEAAAGAEQAAATAAKAEQAEAAGTEHAGRHAGRRAAWTEVASS